MPNSFIYFVAKPKLLVNDANSIQRFTVGEVKMHQYISFTSVNQYRKLSDRFTSDNLGTNVRNEATACLLSPVSTSRVDGSARVDG